MAIVINGNGIDMGNNPVSNASQIDGVVINENNENVATTSNLVGFKNYLINGNFDIWQRGAGPFTNYAYGADRWLCYHTTPIMSSSSTSSNGIQKRIAHIKNVTAGYAFLAQPIELPLKGFGHPFTVGKKFTVSVKYSSTTKIRPRLIFRDGAAGANPVELDSSMTSPVYKGGSGVAQIVSWTFTVDGTAAITNTCLVLQLHSESNASDVYMFQVQLEEGSVATPFEQRPIGLELSLCQRYYEVGRQPNIYMNNVSCSAAHGTCFFNVEKRVDPSITTNSFNYYSGGESIAFQPAITSSLTKYGFIYSSYAFTNWNGWNGSGTWTADAEL